MSLIGYADFDRPIELTSGPVFFAFGGGAFQLQPTGCGVLTSDAGRVECELELVRALSDRDAHALLTCTLGVQYETEEALTRARAIDPVASLSHCVLTDWWFRFLPTPALRASDDLLAPVQLASNGLGTARLMTSLSIDSGLILEAVLKEHGSLEAVAEAQIEGVSPRVPVVVRFDSPALFDDLMRLADPTGALPRRLVVDYFRRDVATLPLEVSGAVDATTTGAFADAMSDRVIDRFGSYIPAQNVDDAPVVRFQPASGSTSLLWSLSEAFLAHRRILLPVDLLSAAQNQVDRLGLDSVVHRRDMATLPSLGRARVKVLGNLPEARTGFDALGATLTFPPHPPARPSPQFATAMLESVDDISEVEVRLSPDEPLRYEYSTFAVLADPSGSQQISSPVFRGEGPVLRLSADDFPVEFALCAVTPALAQLAIISGSCTYEHEGQVHQRSFVLDIGKRSISIAVPRDRSSLLIDVRAIARDGSGELSLGPFEVPTVSLDVSSFATYGPMQAEVRCVFDDGAATQAVSLLAMGDADTAENITTLALTPADPVRTFHWFAESPFRSGFKYRPHHGSNGEWTEVPTGNALVVYSSRLHPQAPRHEVAASSLRPIRETMVHDPRHRVEADAVVPETGVVPIGRSPSPDPTDELLYERIDDPSKKMFVPRYELDVQVVSGQQRYRIALEQRETYGTLVVNIVGAPAPSLADQAHAATAYDHLLAIELDFLVSASAGVRKLLTFTDVTRNANIVTASLTFASLAERDDVYRALTETDRQARLVVRRFIDVAVPQRTTTTPSDALDPSQLITLLPRRPIVGWPLKYVAVPQEPILTRPVDPDPIIVNVASVFVGMNARLGMERAPMLTALNARTPTSARVDALRSRRVVDPVVILMPIAGFADQLPTPQLAVTGRRLVNGAERFLLSIVNWADFSDGFFAASPDLPPCGRNQSASRTWVDIQDADTGTRLYGFCDLGSAEQLNELWFSTGDGSVPANVRVTMIDRRTGTTQASNAVATATVQPDAPSYLSVRQELVQVVSPEPFAFPAALHSYIFQGSTPTTGNNQLIRYRFLWKNTFHTYLQDASRPSVVYIFPDQFKIARRREPPFTPFATVRVSWRSDGTLDDVVFDYIVAPFVDPRRLEPARAALLADPRFGSTQVEFQPLLTNDVRFKIDRPVRTGSVQEERPNAAVVLQSWLKDTLRMPLNDFQVLFQSMHQETASLFLGQVEIDVPNTDTEVIPFVAKLDDLQGEMFLYNAVAQEDGLIQVTLTNAIESAVTIHTLDATITRGSQRVRGIVQGTTIPKEHLLPGESIQVTLSPEAAMSSTAPPEVTFDLSGVAVTADVEAIWNSILDRTTLDCFRNVTVKASASLFDVVAGHEDERIVSILVDFEGGGTAELIATKLEATVRIDYPIDDAVLGRPISSTYRYTVTVVRAKGQDRDATPREGLGDIFYVSVTS